MALKRCLKNCRPGRFSRRVSKLGSATEIFMLSFPFWRMFIPVGLGFVADNEQKPDQKCEHDWAVRMLGRQLNDGWGFTTGSDDFCVSDAWKVIADDEGVPRMNESSRSLFGDRSFSHNRLFSWLSFTLVLDRGGLSPIRAIMASIF